MWVSHARGQAGATPGGTWSDFGRRNGSRNYVTATWAHQTEGKAEAEALSGKLGWWLRRGEDTPELGKREKM